MKLLNKDFILVLIGQIIFLFGNAIMRFALPLYLLNQTGSAALFGMVSACAFVPMILAAPVGGIFADRVNKRNIMVILDFTTAALTLGSTLVLGRMDLILLILVTLIILYGIQGAYQPAVQASIPVLVPKAQIVQANSMVTLVNSLSSLVGPVIGGAVFGFFGIMPILVVSIICFLASAIMEIFINIPFTPQPNDENIFKMGLNDIKGSFHYMLYEKKIILKGSLLVAAINLLLSSCAMIGLPVIVTQHLGFSASVANSMYGYIEGFMGAGSLAGGILAGVLAKKIGLNKQHIVLLLCGLMFLPMSIVMFFDFGLWISYFTIAISCFLMMALASFFSVQMMAFLQIITPEKMLGEIISCAMCLGMCATPLGQAIYGILYQQFSSYISAIIFVVVVLTSALALGSRKMFITMNVPALTEVSSRQA
ncbi:MFS transporter [Aminicella lysinilytica]|uniref:Sugar phosphate permease n=1 Tax=Aminicella lysinilytica TaxID=433323 RepID=A0A4R6Q0M1_9FIRM|nr:MFS transporter [Aminicella lysinilytica]TDP52996.1 sugar phosphate permease [Aminicella lysinilytica]